MDSQKQPGALSQAPENIATAYNNCDLDPRVQYFFNVLGVLQHLAIVNTILLFAHQGLAAKF